MAQAVTVVGKPGGAVGKPSAAGEGNFMQYADFFT